jgi:DNA mismatch repair ATPase MutS
LFATHFHELTLLEQEVPNVKNLHVEAYVGDSEIALLYKVSPGPCDKSFGINIAEMTKFPQEIIQVFF